MWTKVLGLMAGVMLVGCNDTNTAPDSSSVEPSSKKKVSSVYQPSELALQMRSMYANLKIVGHEIHEGQQISDSLLQGYEAILTAEASDPKELDDMYYGMANQWLVTIEALQKAPNLTNYNRVMDGCVACHQQKCPGPINKIQRLKL